MTRAPESDSPRPDDADPEGEAGNSAAPASRKDRAPHYGWLVLAVGLTVIFSALGLGRFGYTLILPPMQEGLDLTNTEAGALATGNFVGYLLLALLGGALASRFSPRRVIAVSALFVGATMILTAFADGFLSALLWRTLTGMGSGGANVPVMGLLAAWFASRRRGLATGVAVAGSSVAMILTGRLIPWILTAFPETGWRMAWMVLGGIGLGVGALAYWLLRDRPEAMGLKPIGWDPTRDDAPADGAGHSDEDAGGQRVERPAPGATPPLAPSWGGVYRSRAVWHLAAIYFAFGFSYIIYVTFFARRLQGDGGYSEPTIGGLWQWIGWLSLVCGVLWGWVSDLVGRKYGLALVFAIQAGAFAVFALPITEGGVWVSVVLFGLTAWSIPAIVAATCGDRLGPKFASAALGFVTLFMGIGQALGPLVAGWLADRTGSFAAGMLCAAGVAAVGCAGSLSLPAAPRTGG